MVTCNYFILTAFLIFAFISATSSKPVKRTSFAQPKHNPHPVHHDIPILSATNQSQSEVKSNPAVVAASANPKKIVHPMSPVSAKQSKTSHISNTSRPRPHAKHTLKPKEKSNQRLPLVTGRAQHKIQDFRQNQSVRKLGAKRKRIQTRTRNPRTSTFSDGATIKKKRQNVESWRESEEIIDKGAMSYDTDNGGVEGSNPAQGSSGSGGSSSSGPGSSGSGNNDGGAGGGIRDGQNMMDPAPGPYTEDSDSEEDKKLASAMKASSKKVSEFNNWEEYIVSQRTKMMVDIGKTETHKNSGYLPIVDPAGHFRYMDSLFKEKNDRVKAFHGMYLFMKQQKKKFKIPQRPIF